MFRSGYGCRKVQGHKRAHRRDGACYMQFLAWTLPLIEEMEQVVNFFYSITFLTTLVTTEPYLRDFVCTNYEGYR
jgi:hypothetical protein